MLWVLEAARAAGTADDLVCAWDEAHDQWSPQGATLRWLRTLQGPATAEVAGVLRRFPRSARHYRDLTGETSVGLTIRAAIHHVTSNQP